MLTLDDRSRNILSFATFSAALAMVGGLVTGCAQDPKPQPDETRPTMSTKAPPFKTTSIPVTNKVDDTLANFPDLSEFATIRKFPVTDAKFLLIHIKLVHGGDSPREGVKSLTKETADLIEKIVLKLQSEASLSSLYQDGLTPETKADAERFILQVENIKNADTLFENAIARYGEAQFKIKFGQRIYDAGMRTRDNLRVAESKFEEYAKYDASYRFMRMGFDVRAGEDSELQKECRGIAEKNDEDPRLPALFERRENNLLSLVAGHESDAIQCAVYGAAHDFEGNIKERNASHPDQKIALVVITPKSIPEDPVALERLIEKLAK